MQILVFKTLEIGIDYSTTIYFGVLVLALCTILAVAIILPLMYFTQEPRQKRKAKVND